ncbi:ninjurin-1 isoform X2 [Neocloeon triangulifer]|uniref:ninjurin-1 isoform X2 n=1 Tax=Neocloeon triangulifer TaxID=2078957 RepID=UPI00286F5FEA|nr:ninjurin-1 isoform X2 [Neocloeon triangulifer]XP_059491263.1 ninjurin-1 isoform X2 [Neocloeon triangulifer]XP_059491264.1 ninjurin-1 isoform X2 [Neocloeon triangulifer]
MEMNNRVGNGNSVTPMDDENPGRRVHKAIDANRYASKKTLAQGMLDIALLTANASQLKYILQVGKQHEFYTLMVTLISVSIVLQVVLGCLALSLNMLRDCRLHQQEYKSSALCLNYLSLSGAFLVSAVNLLIAVFNPRPLHPAAPV